MGAIGEERAYAEHRSVCGSSDRLGGVGVGVRSAKRGLQFTLLVHTKGQSPDSKGKGIPKSASTIWFPGTSNFHEARAGVPHTRCSRDLTYMPDTTEDIFRLALENPDLRDRILAKSTGVIGEFLVERKIASLGYAVTRASNNRRQSDLVIKSSSGVPFSVEVKVDRRRRPTWFVRKRPDPAASAFWIFGASILDPSAVEYFVLTVNEVRSLWDQSDWNKRNPTNGDMRRWQIPDDALEAWHKFPR